MTTKIEWCDETWNPITGCTKIREGCKNCYAEKMSMRLKAMGVNKYRNGFDVTFHSDSLNDPSKWKKPRRIFVCSMSDLFHEKVPDYHLDYIFNTIYYDGISHHTFVILTKRPDRMLKYLQHDYISSFVKHSDNVQYGVSISTQKDADEMIPILLQIKAMFPNLKVFVSVEPLLENVCLHKYFWESNPNYMPPRFLDEGETYNEPHEIKIDSNETLNGIIIGCESGPKRRPCKIEWIEDIVKQVEYAGIPVFVKQAQDENGKVVKMPEINGKVYNQYPE